MSQKVVHCFYSLSTGKSGTIKSRNWKRASNTSEREREKERERKRERERERDRVREREPRYIGSKPYFVGHGMQLLLPQLSYPVASIQYRGHNRLLGRYPIH